MCIAAFAGATIAKANMWKTAFSAFKFAKFLYLGPLLFGYVPGFSLDGSAMDIIKAFVAIILRHLGLCLVSLRYLAQMVQKRVWPAGLFLTPGSNSFCIAAGSLSRRRILFYRQVARIYKQ